MLLCINFIWVSQSRCVKLSLHSACRVPSSVYLVAYALSRVQRLTEERDQSTGVVWSLMLITTYASYTICAWLYTPHQYKMLYNISEVWGNSCHAPLMCYVLRGVCNCALEKVCLSCWNIVHKKVVVVVNCGQATWVYHLSSWPNLGLCHRWMVP